MDTALARHVVLAGHRSLEELQDLADFVQNHCSQSECDEFHLGVLRVEQKIQALLTLIFANHPGLQQDISEKITKYGKPL
jgi:hypothetical protein